MRHNWLLLDKNLASSEADWTPTPCATSSTHAHVTTWKTSSLNVSRERLVKWHLEKMYCSCLDLLPNGACKVPQTSRGDRWEETGQVGAGRGKCRPKRILRGRQEPWHSVLVSYIKLFYLHLWLHTKSIIHSEYIFHVISFVLHVNKPAFSLPHFTVVNKAWLVFYILRQKIALLLFW